MDIWGFIATFFWIFVLAAYLMVVFSIIADIFRDSSTNGWLKAVWIVFLIFLPVLTALVYLIVRGSSMQERSRALAAQQRSADEAFIRQTAGSGSSASEEIAKAKDLRDTGVISQAEFDALKAKALA